MLGVTDDHLWDTSIATTTSCLIQYFSRSEVWSSLDQYVSYMSITGSVAHCNLLLADLDIVKTKEEALTRWLRPNEIYAILCNCVYFRVNVKPVELPQSKYLLVMATLADAYYI